MKSLQNPHFFAILGVVLTMLQPTASAQESLGLDNGMFEKEALGAAPESFLLDKARLFKDREAEQLSARLKAFSAASGKQIYVAAYSVLIGETIDGRAARLKDLWLANSQGIVVVYQRGDDVITFSANAGPEFVEREDLHQLFRDAFLAAAVHDRGSGRVLAAVDHIMSALPEAVQTQQSVEVDTRSEAQGFVGWALLALGLLAAGGMVASHFLRGVQLEETKSYSFPKFEVPSRFGAPYSGGHQAEIQFTVPPS